MVKFAGCVYPIVKSPRGFFHTQSGTSQIRSDLLILLLTNPGERVMMPEFGTPLKDLVFEQNDEVAAAKARELIAHSISTWEPRIVVQNIDVTTQLDQIYDPNAPMTSDAKEESEHILCIRISFFDPQDINSVQDLVLEVPLSGG